MERRSFLALATTGTALFAGCIGGSDNATTPDDNSNTENEDPLEDTVFESIGFDGLELYATIKEDADVDAVEMSAEGEHVGTFTYESGVVRDSSGSVDQSWYGTVTFTATKDGEEVGSVAKEFAPELVVTGIQRAEGETIEEDSELFGGRTEWPEVAWRESGDLKDWLVIDVTIKNIGNAPAFISESYPAAVTDGIPIPGDKEELSYYGEGAENSSSSIWGPDQTTIPAGESVVERARGNLGIDTASDHELRAEMSYRVMEDWCGSTRTATVVVIDDNGREHTTDLDVTYEGEFIYYTYTDYGVGTCETIRTE